MSDLAELGLSSYEERAYRALLGLGRATASDVAAASDVPEGRIYDVLNGLGARDLVRTHAGDPRRYEAVAPERAVDRLLAEREQELDRERARYERLAAAASAELAQTLPVEGQFWQVGMGSDDAVATMAEQFERADEQLLSVVGPPYGETPAAAASAEAAAYADLVGDDVEAKLLTTPAVVETHASEALLATLERTDGFALRTTTDIELTYDVLDGTEVCLTVPAPFTPGERVGGAVVRDADLAAAMAERFHDAWAEATPVAE